MIARIWRGMTAASNADEYLEYLRLTGMREYKETDGNRGVFVLRRTQGEHTEFILLSLWESMDAVRRFAGENADIAKYYPRDAHYLLELEPHVRHYEVADVLDLEGLVSRG
jgi:heme-degrading monooxygenase HmoA